MGRNSLVLVSILNCPLRHGLLRRMFGNSGKNKEPNFQSIRWKELLRLSKDAPVL